MITDILKPLRTAVCCATIALSSLAITGTGALATITSGAQTEPVTQASPASKTTTPSPTAAIADTREILSRASSIAFEGATAVQKQQTLSVDTATAEMLKNYMASMIYVPQAMALPSDAEALDEPWMASASGTTSDGMVVPNLGDDDDSEPADTKDMEIGAPSTAKSQFLKFLKPVQSALITSPFGSRWGRPHQGIDMGAPMGTPILSAEHGKVVYSGWKQGYGNFVAINHGHGYETHYAHCSKILVHTGQRVTKGQQIAKVGSTGHSTGPHLHFEVVANGVHRNPAKFINQVLTVVEAH